MKVFVIGAHGHIGHKITVKLAHSGHQVLAGMRKTDEYSSLPDSSLIKPVHFDLTKSVANMVHIFKSNHVDSIIFSAGAGGGVKPSTTLSVDLDGAAKSIRAAKEAGIKRYEMISAYGSDDRKVWHATSLYVYYVAKHYADLYLRQSGLNYTIFHPVALSNDPGTGKVKSVSNSKSALSMSIPREDVATAAVDALNQRSTIKREYSLARGNVPISNLF